MAMLFYLPRLFVYHMENIEIQEYINIIKIQEIKLYKYIGLPAFWATFISGITMLLVNPSIFSSGGWMHAKLTLVILLIIYSFSLGYYLQQLANNKCTKSGKFFRFYNEIPTLLAIGIIILVVIKPF